MKAVLDVRSLAGWLVVALLAGGACGGTPLRARGDAGAAAEVSGETVPSPDLGTDTRDGGAPPRYAGLVLGMMTQEGAAASFVVRALFTAEPRPMIGGCPHCCCGGTDRGLPYPIKPPDAGKITVATAAGATLATLVPAAFEGGSGSFYGMGDLGWGWARPLGNYAPVDSQPWHAGDALQVVATGGEVESFAQVLATGPSLAGIVPPIGPAPIVVDHSQPFTISWAPQGQGDAVVLLSLPYAGGICYCDAPDSAGRITVEANLLSPISAEKNAKIKLARLTAATVASGNATIDLVGADVQSGPFAVE